MPPNGTFGRDHPVGVDPHRAGAQRVRDPVARGACPWSTPPPPARNGVSLASAIASSSVSNGSTASTGPKISSRATVMSGVTSVSTVGRTNKPPSSGAGPPAGGDRRALGDGAARRSRSTLRYCGSVGQRAHLGRRRPRVAEPDRSGPLRRSGPTSSSCTSRCTSSRDPAMQVCPVAANTPATTPLAAASRSASANTTCADLPPSSSVTPVMFSRGRLGHLLADRGRAGERDLVHAGVCGQRLADSPARTRSPR